jgi:lipopolysaccharide/colanic/teichoic acid biosynthesis glycosyltransferase
MHPYSEYLQDYVVKMNGYNETGKPNKDFRLTGWGKIIRKFHLDEIPQLINVLKGELNIVGVRPLSKFGFESLPLDLQRERIKYKAGCIPPNVALGLTGFEGVIRAERIYLREMKKNRFLTNFKYFWMALFNIIRRKNTSA